VIRKERLPEDNISVAKLGYRHISPMFGLEWNNDIFLRKRHRKAHRRCRLCVLRG
jgi:hypothetical protein